MKATIKKFTFLNLSAGQVIVYILGRFTQKASLLACTVLPAFPLKLCTDLRVSSAYKEITRGQESPGNRVDRTFAEGDKTGGNAADEIINHNILIH